MREKRGRIESITQVDNYEAYKISRIDSMQNSEHSQSVNDKVSNMTNFSISRHWHNSPQNVFSQQEASDQVSWEDSPDLLDKVANSSNMVDSDPSLYSRLYSSLAIPRMSAHPQIESVEPHIDASNNALDAIMQLLEKNDHIDIAKNIEFSQETKKEESIILGLDRGSYQESVLTRPSAEESKGFESIVKAIKMSNATLVGSHVPINPGSYPMNRAIPPPPAAPSSSSSSSANPRYVDNISTAIPPSQGIASGYQPIPHVQPLPIAYIPISTTPRPSVKPPASIPQTIPAQNHNHINSHAPTYRAASATSEPQKQLQHNCHNPQNNSNTQNTQSLFPPVILPSASQSSIISSTATIKPTVMTSISTTAKSTTSTSIAISHTSTSSSIISDEEMAFYEELERKELERQAALKKPLQPPAPALATSPMNTYLPPQSQVEFISDEEMAQLEELERQMMNSLQSQKPQIHPPPPISQPIPIQRAPPRPQTFVAPQGIIASNSSVNNNRMMPPSQPHVSQALRPLSQVKAPPSMPINAGHPMQQHHNRPVPVHAPQSQPSRTIVPPMPMNRLLPSTQLVGESICEDGSIPFFETTSDEIKHRNEMISCRRYTALDVNDNYHGRYKDINCIESSAIVNGPDPSHSSSTSMFARTSIIRVSGHWYATDIVGGDSFHIIMLGKNDMESTCNMMADTDCRLDGITEVNDEYGIIVVQPDMLISPTKIAESCSCVRRGVISERVRLFGDQSAAAVLGILKHCFIEKLISRRVNQHLDNGSDSKISSNTDIDALILSCVAKHAEELYAVGCNDDQAKAELSSIIQPTMTWIDKMIHVGIDQSPSDSAKHVMRQSLIMHAVEAVEETIWSPVLGIKGQLDVTITCAEVFSSSGCHYYSFNHSMIMPLEIKTGKWRPSTVMIHRAQVIIYILMLLIRDGRKSKHGLMHDVTKRGIIVYISATDDNQYKKADNGARVEVIIPSWAEIQALIIARNSLSWHLKKYMDTSSSSRPMLPPMLRSADCEFCYQAAECMTYHATLENGTALTSGVPELFAYLTRHIASQHSNYLVKWDRLVDLESMAQSNMASTHQIWTQSSSLREEKSDKCIGGLDFVSYEESSSSCPAKNSSTATKLIFMKLLSISHIKPLDVGNNNDNKRRCLGIGDRVFISIEKDWNDALHHCHRSQQLVDIEDTLTSHAYNISDTVPNIAIGQIVHVSIDGHEVHVSITGNVPRGLIKHMKSNSIKFPITRFRLDKDDGSVGISTLRSNVLSLFTKPFNPAKYREQQKIGSNPDIESPFDSRLRELIVDLAPPKFISWDIHTSTIPTITTLFCPRDVLPSIYNQALYSLNAHYRRRYSHMIDNEYRPDIISMAIRTTSSGIELFGGVTIYDGCNPFDLYAEYLTLNQGQRDALHKVLIAEDYALILGLPGSGKTQTLNLIVRTLIARHQRVLISSYTNTAVDNLMIKLQKSGVSPSIAIRLGSLASIHPDIHAYCIDTRNSPVSSTPVIYIRDKLNTVRLVACTVLTAATSRLLGNFHSDWSIVDEAGQISQPAILGALFRTRSFLLVGDDYQLPPLVVSSEAQAQGMNISLFKRLSEAFPESVTALTAQYRMNQDIMTLCNELIYEHRMSCGSPSIASQRFDWAGYQRFNSICSSITNISSCINWLNLCLGSSQSAIFLNTDIIFNKRGEDNNNTSAMKCRTSSSHSDPISMTNTIEKDIILLIVKTLSSYGYIMENLGIISPYKAQVNLLQQSISECQAGMKSVAVPDFIQHKNVMPISVYGHDRDNLNHYNHHDNISKKSTSIGCEVSTVDRFQGRDMDMVIFSSVRSMNDSSIGDLLRDWRRINVAITRAKKKLIIVGSIKIMEKIPILNALVQVMQRNQWVVNLPIDALNMNDPSVAVNNDMDMI